MNSWIQKAEALRLLRKEGKGIDIDIKAEVGDRESTYSTKKEEEDHKTTDPPPPPPPPTSCPASDPHSLFQDLIDSTIKCYELSSIPLSNVTLNYCKLSRLIDVKCSP